MRSLFVMVGSSLVDCVDVDGRQPISMPRRVLTRGPEQMTKEHGPFGQQSICGPGEALEMLREPPHHVLDVALSKNLIFRHRAGPTKQKFTSASGGGSWTNPG